MAAATAIGGIALDVVTGAIKNSTIARQSVVLKLLGLIAVKLNQR
jgi:hypothetical protein